MPHPHRSRAMLAAFGAVLLVCVGVSTALGFAADEQTDVLNRFRTWTLANGVVYHDIQLRTLPSSDGEEQEQLLLQTNLFGSNNSSSSDAIHRRTFVRASSCCHETAAAHQPSPSPLLLSVPARLFIGCPVMVEELGSTMAAWLVSELGIDFDSPRTSRLCLVLLLLHQQVPSPHPSRFRPYWNVLKLLVPLSSLNLLHTWSRDDLLALRLDCDGEAQREVERRTEQVHRQVEQILNLLDQLHQSNPSLRSQLFPLTDLHHHVNWALSIVHSRHFGFHNRSTNVQQQQEPAVLFIPPADFFNHQFSSDPLTPCPNSLEFLYNNNDNTMVTQFIVHDNLGGRQQQQQQHSSSALQHAGDPVHFCYFAEGSNAKFLANDGFVPTDNPYECVRLQLPSVVEEEVNLCGNTDVAALAAHLRTRYPQEHLVQQLQHHLSHCYHYAGTRQDDNEDGSTSIKRKWAAEYRSQRQRIVSRLLQQLTG